jgi:hypothetical protein
VRLLVVLQCAVICVMRRAGLGDRFDGYKRRMPLIPALRALLYAGISADESTLHTVGGRGSL